MSKTIKAEPAAKQGVAKDLFAGTMGGIAQVLVGQPFDIVKVRLQSSDVYKGGLDCAQRILKEEGPRAFYKGTAMPLVGIGACVSLQFAGLAACKNYFTGQNVRNGKSNPQNLTPAQLYLSGAGGGVLNSVVSGPVEHIRIRLQTQTKAAGSMYFNGPWDACKKLYATDGLRGIYHGQGSTLLREFHGYGCYFLAYELLVQRRMAKDHIERKDIPALDSLLYGALAGYGLWLGGAYPLDAIKSKIQTDGLPSQGDKRKYHGVLSCIRKTYATQGLGGFFKGFVPTIIRSPFANGATFAAFEITLRMISS